MCCASVTGPSCMTAYSTLGPKLSEMLLFRRVCSHRQLSYFFRAGD